MVGFGGLWWTGREGVCLSGVGGAWRAQMDAKTASEKAKRKLDGRIARIRRDPGEAETRRSRSQLCSPPLDRSVGNSPDKCYKRRGERARRIKEWERVLGDLLCTTDWTTQLEAAKRARPWRGLVEFQRVAGRGEGGEWGSMLGGPPSGRRFGMDRRTTTAPLCCLWCQFAAPRAPFSA